MAPVGKLLVLLGAALVIIGAALWGLSRLRMVWLPLLGRLPGDIYVRRGGVSFYFPLTTCIVLSIVLSLVLSFLIRR